MSIDKNGAAPQAEAEKVQDEVKADVQTDAEEEVKESPKEDTKEEVTQETPKADKKADKKVGRKESRKEEEKKAPEKIPSMADEMAELNDRYLRLCAEYDNFRRRSQKEKDSLYGDIKAETVKSFLPVYDNLERALAQSTEDEAYRKGVEMIMNQFITTLEKLGVSPIDSLGQKFDPSLHNAVMHTEDGEKGENEIVEVFQKGFKLGDKVIRFSMVKVAN